MRRLLRVEFVGVLVLIMAVVGGCHTSRNETKRAKTVAFISNTSSSFWNMMRRGCERADAELPNVDVAFKTPYGGTAVEQDRLIQEALKRDNADAIAISPIDPVNQKRSINDAAKRSLVITQDSDAPDSDRLLYIGADNLSAGRQAGALIKSVLPRGGKIAVFVGKLEVQNAQDRYQGLRESLEGSTLQIVDLLTDNNDLAQAKTNAAQTIKKHPDIAGMVGLWYYNGPGIVAAVREARKVGKIKIVCFDDDEETLEGIKEGAIFATIAQQPFVYGYQGIQLLAKILNGDLSVIPESRKIIIPPEIVQQDNVDEYKKRQVQLISGR
ncbi:MAG TPA: sugar-binding protein [Blastocatellia bacterium]|nr:sugar-binding protein [Blastocatellia bacterium]